jgi:hypothetical protein
MTPFTLGIIAHFYNFLTGNVFLLRTARQISKTHIYHVILRGNEKKNVFLDSEDKARFIDGVFETKRM